MLPLDMGSLFDEDGSSSAEFLEAGTFSHWVVNEAPFSTASLDAVYDFMDCYLNGDCESLNIIHTIAADNSDNSSLSQLDFAGYIANLEQDMRIFLLDQNEDRRPQGLQLYPEKELELYVYIYIYIYPRHSLCYPS